LIYVLFLLMVTAVWGWTFVLVKDALTHYPTLPFLQLRFILAFLVMAVLVRRLPTRREAWVGVIAGVVLAGGYLTQTVGLTITSPGNSGLITGLFVVFTPLIDRIFGVALRWYTLVAVAAAFWPAAKYAPAAPGRSNPVAAGCADAADAVGGGWCRRRWGRGARRSLIRRGLGHCHVGYCARSARVVPESPYPGTDSTWYVDEK